MKARTQLFKEQLTSSFWLAPTLAGVTVALLAYGTLQLDRNTALGKGVGWLWYGGSAEGARAVLATVTGGMITVAGVVFSVTILALTLAVTAFSPRLLRTFSKSGGYQIVFAIFLATFLYSLLVLRTVRAGESGDAFVPHISVTIALLFAVVSIAALIYFIHYVARSIEIETQLEELTKDIDAVIDELFPDEIGDDVQRDEQGERLEHRRESGALLCSRRTGYLQAVEGNDLLRCATEHDLTVELLHRPGDFIIEGEPLAMVYPEPRASRLLDTLREAFTLGRMQTPTQDVQFAMRRVLEIASMALSSGKNDPFTAISCIDCLTHGLARLAQRRVPSAVRSDQFGCARVVTPVTEFCTVANMTFHLLRQHAVETAEVVLKLIDAIELLAPFIRRAPELALLRQHLNLLAEEAQEAIASQVDRVRIEQRAELARLRVESLSRTERQAAAEVRARWLAGDEPWIDAQ